MTLACADTRDRLQGYLDGTLAKSESVAIFLHLRDCGGCREEHEHLQAMFSMLDELPQLPVPDDFDARILDSIPLAAYREMEPLRRDRVPVFLEESYLPAWLRDARTRLAGLSVTLAAVIAVAVADQPQPLLLAAVVGAVPEILVRCQGWARQATLAWRRAEN
ncbi:MAG: hypothetical protein GY838_08270 [bacterium]|nr:hypothetical protein [bacterium]